MTACSLAVGARLGFYPFIRSAPARLDAWVAAASMFVAVHSSLESALDVGVPWCRAQRRTVPTGQPNWPRHQIATHDVSQRHVCRFYWLFSCQPSLLGEDPNSSRGGPRGRWGVHHWSAGGSSAYLPERLARAAYPSHARWVVSLVAWLWSARCTRRSDECVTNGNVRWREDVSTAARRNVGWANTVSLFARIACIRFALWLPIPADISVALSSPAWYA
jgi:hypothetical protein